LSRDIRALNDAGKIPSKEILMDFFRFVMPGLERMAEEEFDKVSSKIGTKHSCPSRRRSTHRPPRSCRRRLQDPSGPPSSGGGIAAELREELSAIAKNIRFAQKNDNPLLEAERESNAMQEELQDAKAALQIALRQAAAVRRK
jgi:hypothetical protein